MVKIKKKFNKYFPKGYGLYQSSPPSLARPLTFINLSKSFIYLKHKFIKKPN